MCIAENMKDIYINEIRELHQCVSDGGDKKECNKVIEALEYAIKTVNEVELWKTETRRLWNLVAHKMGCNIRTTWKCDCGAEKRLWKRDSIQEDSRTNRL